jgi:hypothetical protein
MVNGDVTQYLPDWVEVGVQAYLVGEDPDEASPGEVKCKKLGPSLFELNSMPGQQYRVLFKIEQGSEDWRFTLSWAAKMFNCFRLNMDFQEDRLVMSGEIMHGGKRVPGKLALVKGDGIAKLEFISGLSFLNGEVWSLQTEKPDWNEEEDDDDW